MSFAILFNPIKNTFLMGIGVLFLSCAKAESVDFPFDESPLSSPEEVRVGSYADVLDPSRAAVVSVTTTSIVEIMRSRGRNPMEDFLRRYYGIPDQAPDGRNEQEPIERRIPNGLGSGVIVSEDGYIVTNNHVVVDESGETADEITVHLNNGEEVNAKLIGRDERTDVALLKIERSDLPFIQMGDSKNLRVGDLVFAIGNPLGVGQTSTMGIISATGRTNLGLLGNQGYEDFIQTDAAINRGNSGGALVDAKGRLIGINSAIYSQTGGNIGIGFAIPSRIVRSVILELINNGKVRRGYLGVSIRNMDKDMAEAFGLNGNKGALVESVEKNTPADIAGIKRGDIIVSVGGQSVENVAELRLRIAGIPPEKSVPIKINREGKEIQMEVTLGSLDDPNAVVTSLDSPLEGISLQMVDEESIDRWKLSVEDGVLVTDVDVRSPYVNIFSPGMVILEVNDKKIDKLSDLTENLRVGVNKLWVSYRGSRGYLALRYN